MQRRPNYWWLSIPGAFILAVLGVGVAIDQAGTTAQATRSQITAPDNRVLTATSAICANYNAGAPLEQSPDATKIPVTVSCQDGKLIVASWVPLRPENVGASSVNVAFQKAVTTLCRRLHAGNPAGPGLQLTPTGGLLLYCSARPYAAGWIVL